MLEQALCRLFDKEYRITEEHIGMYKDISFEDRVRLLEEVNDIIFRILPKDQLKKLRNPQKDGIYHGYVR